MARENATKSDGSPLSHFENPLKPVKATGLRQSLISDDILGGLMIKVNLSRQKPQRPAATSDGRTQGLGPSRHLTMVHLDVATASCAQWDFQF